MIEEAVFKGILMHNRVTSPGDSWLTLKEAAAYCSRSEEFMRKCRRNRIYFQGRAKKSRIDQWHLMIEKCNVRFSPSGKPLGDLEKFREWFKDFQETVAEAA